MDLCRTPTAGIHTDSTFHYDSPPRLSAEALAQAVGSHGRFQIMWRRDVCLRPEWDWASKPQHWEQKAAEARRGMESTITELKAAGWSDADVAQVARDRLEEIEVCSINVELLNRTGSFDDPAWIERRSLAARERLDAETDPIMMLGRRKLVRKWNEEIMRFQMTVRIKSRMACGNQAGAEAAYREFAEWMRRPDRKDFDETG